MLFTKWASNDSSVKDQRVKTTGELDWFVVYFSQQTGVLHTVCCQRPLNGVDSFASWRD